MARAGAVGADRPGRTPAGVHARVDGVTPPPDIEGSRRMTGVRTEDSTIAQSGLSVTVAPFGAEVRRTIALLAPIGFRSMQLSAAQPGIRPRDLDRGARRDLRAFLARRGTSCSGVDLWIPAAHFLDPARADAAVQAVCDAIGLAADLATDDRARALSTVLPGDPPDARVAIQREAARCGVTIVDFSTTGSPVSAAGTGGAADAMASGAASGASRASVVEWTRIGIDPAALLAQGRDPIDAVIASTGRIGAARLVSPAPSGGRGPVVGGRGDGRFNLTMYRAALTVSGPEVPVIVDARGWTGDLVEGARATAHAWCRAGADPTAEVDSPSG
ncbi:MAG: hypothetical protein KF817_09910 [Phycisphaeraceae bacterium]|nr:hypothetical protein [Phycisphaeraceae bacterium]